MLNFVIGFFVGALTLYVAVCAYYYIKVKKLYKRHTVKVPDIDYDGIAKAINEMKPIDQMINKK